jgi:hypothetical protein
VCSTPSRGECVPASSGDLCMDVRTP